jgi:ABC-type uncharacterized transport system ATPase subunit
VSLRADADPQDLLKACVGKMSIQRFEVVNPTLQNIFIALVGDEDASGQPAPAPVAMAVGR